MIQEDIDLNKWINISLDSVISHYRKGKGTFLRTSDSDPSQFYPTATFHSLNSLCLCLRLKNVFKKVIAEKKFVEIETAIRNVLSVILKIPKKNWTEKLLSFSSHYQGDLNNPRNLVVISQFVNSILNCSKIKFSNTPEKELASLKAGLKDICKTVFQIHKNNGDKIFVPVGESPASLVNYANSLIALKELVSNGFFSTNINISGLLDDACKQVHHHVNYNVSRYQEGKRTTFFDPVSLTACLHVLSKSNSSYLDVNYRNLCFEILSKTQYSDGCWPNGVSLTFSDTADVVQQPSVGVALNLITSLLNKSYLFDKSIMIKKTLSEIIPSLNKFASYCTNTYYKGAGKENSISGWSSDRIRRKKYSESWITAQTASLFMQLYIANKCLSRQDALDSLGLKSFRQKKDHNDEIWSSLHEPDSAHQPLKKIFDSYIKPLQKQKHNNYTFLLPKSSSFIVFGPPGSGKTFMVKTLAETLNWPLVELSPGHFIKNGLEHIESTAKDIFDKLDNLFHAIVFFDECDELFRDRSKTEQNRSILSFATASMLPKIQDLHDNKTILFILGTNYISKIDSAIKRAGRFDDHFLLDLPDNKSRLTFLIKNKNIEESIAKEHLSNTEGMTIADLFKYNVKEPINHDSIEYQEWCESIGALEVDSSRIDLNEKKNIFKRWKSNFSTEKLIYWDKYFEIKK